MARQPDILRPIRLHTTFPEDIRAKLDLYLYSEAEGRVPKGAYQRFIIERIRQFFSRDSLILDRDEQRMIKRLIDYHDAISGPPQDYWIDEGEYRCAQELLRRLIDANP